MFRNLPLATKLLLTIVPLFVLLILDAYILTSQGQEEAMLEQAKNSAFEKAHIVRLSLVQQMLESERVSDSYLAGLQKVGGLQDLYIRIKAEHLRLNEDYADSSRMARLMQRERDALAHGTIGEEVFQTGNALFVHRDENLEAIIPFKAERRCQTCHDVPISHVLGAAHITVPMGEIKASIAANSQRTAAITLGFGILTIIVGSLLYHSLIRKPMKALVAATDAISQGNLNVPVDVSGASDEFGVLSRSFDNMRKGLKTAQDALRTSTVGQIAQSLIRDFRAPMRLILTAVEQIEKGNPDPDTRARLAGVARDSVVDMNKMAQDLVDYTTGAMKTTKRSANLQSLLTYVADNVRPDLERDMIKLEVQHGVQANVNIDYERFSRALANIIIYATNYVPPDGTIRLASKTRDTGFQVVVNDNGSGIPAQFRDKVFEPFTKIVQEKGLGLNMALAKRIVEMQGGTVRVESEEGKGTSFVIDMNT